MPSPGRHPLDRGEDDKRIDLHRLDLRADEDWHCWVAFVAVPDCDTADEEEPVRTGDDDAGLGTCTDGEAVLLFQPAHRLQLGTEA